MLAFRSGEWLIATVIEKSALTPTRCWHWQAPRDAVG